MYRGLKNAYKIFVRKADLGDLGLDRKVILRWMLRN
jgi:hypothetical protein